MDSAAQVQEEDLVQRLQEGERSCFDQLVARHQQRGLAIAYRVVGNLEDARDVLQEAFVKAYMHIGTFQKKSKFSTWFYRIVVNTGLDMVRKRKRARLMTLDSFREGDEQRVLDIPDSKLAPDTLALSKEFSFLLERRISDLPERQRVCFALKFQDGMPTQQVAQVLGISVATVKVHLFRALEALRAGLSGYMRKA
jgi:RNA polymerase sigma-70 factor, ECF subfamily